MIINFQVFKFIGGLFLCCIEEFIKSYLIEQELLNFQRYGLDNQLVLISGFRELLYCKSINNKSWWQLKHLHAKPSPQSQLPVNFSGHKFSSHVIKGHETRVK